MIIGLNGLIGSGKSSVAKVLCEEYGFKLMKFAAPLKDMLRAIGLTEEHIEGVLKEEPCEMLCGKSPRYAMLTLGTEWGRDMIGADFWCNLALARAKQFHGDIVFDDCRFPGESDALRRLGGYVWRISRPSMDSMVMHKSETEQYKVRVNRVVVNDGTLEQLAQEVREAMRLSHPTDKDGYHL